MQPTETSFTRLIEKSEQRQYLRLPFDVREDAEELTVSYNYTRHRVLPGEEGITYRREVNIIDLALEDPDHSLVGASGSERLSVTIHENHATPGYQPRQIKAGTWYLVLGAYLVEEEGCLVSITVSQKKKETVLLRGDTHCHTVHSDGRYTVDQLIDRVRQDRLDFLFVTDHNAMSSNDTLRSYPDITVLPGVEITYYGGHYNLFGVKRPVKTYVANTRAEVISIMREGKASGALACVNHPIDGGGCGWTFGVGDDVPLDMIEIWNGPFTPWNQGSVDLWQSELSKGRIWPAIGGSDCHKSELFRTFAAPCTFLYSRGRSGSDIIEAMRSGHAFVGMDGNAPVLYMSLGEARMGDIHEGEEDVLFIRAGELREGDELRLINQNGLIKTWQPGGCHSFETQAQTEDSLFVRLEVRRQLPGIGSTLASISNPVYIRRKAR